jgi:hypothetical protein
MRSDKEVKEVEGALTVFFEGLGAGDRALIQDAWHPEAKLFLHNATLTSRPLSFLLNLPEHMDFHVQAIRHVDVHEVIATARADYDLAVGMHSGFFTLVKVKGRWLISNWVDHGVEAPSKG